MKTTTKVSIGKRKCANGIYTYFLDYQVNGRRVKESTEAKFIPNPKTAAERFKNKQDLELIQNLQAIKVIELQDNRYGLHRTEKTSLSYYDFYARLMRSRKDSLGNYGNWASALKYIKKFFGTKLDIHDLTIERCLQFRHFIERDASTVSRRPLSQNSRYSYLNKFKASLRVAYKERIIRENLADFIPGLSQGETHREYLTFEEVQALVDTPCDYPVTKRAFLFSCLTGIRFGDIKRLTWSCLRHSTSRGYELSFRQQKTRGKEYLPLSEQAVEMLGERKGDSEFIFEGLIYSDYVNAAIARWVLRADIRKKITFHCARHTHAVLLLENNIDLYTVSKMLGHREIKTTQIYAKIVDRKKIEAASSLPKLRL